MYLRHFTLLLAVLAVGLGSLAVAQRRITNFQVPQHAFNFSNDFINIFVGDWTTNGLCGGMSYAALDYFNASRPIPRMDARPANGTVLQQFIYNRQVNSVVDNVDKWAELGINPFGTRSSEFFRWGIQGFGGGRLQELREMIDQGRPVPLSLFEYGEGTRAKSHQVLAIGYDLGGFTGTDRNHQFFGTNAQNLRIFVYDPNVPTRQLTLRPDTTLQGFYYEEWRTLPHGNLTPSARNYLWRTYFVDKQYIAQTPPTINEVNLGRSDGLARELRLDVRMWNQRLPGGNQNLDVTVNYEEGAPQVIRNINGGHHWVNNYWEHVPLALSRAVHPAMISSVVVHWTGSGNLPVHGISAHVRGGFEGNKTFSWAVGDNAPLFTFTPQNRTHTIVNEESLVRQVTLEIRTGANRLPGGGQNVNIIVSGRGAIANLNNANQGAPWPANTTQTVTATFNRPVRMADINTVALISQVSGSNTWTIESVRVRATRAGGGPERVLTNQSGTPLHTFTASARSYSVNLR